MSIELDTARRRESEGTTQSGIGVMIIDARRLMLEALSLLVGTAPDVSVTALAASLDDARRYAGSRKPDVAIVGPHRHDHPDGRRAAALEMIDTVNSASPATGVVLVSASSDVDEMREAFGSRATCVIHAEAEVEDFHKAVRLAAQDRPWIPAGLAVDLLRAERSESVSGLTPRETEILKGIALGFTNSQLALKLCISVRTVESHRARVQQKLGTSSRAELVRHAIDQGLVG